MRKNWTGRIQTNLMLVKYKSSWCQAWPGTPVLSDRGNCPADRDKRLIVAQGAAIKYNPYTMLYSQKFIIKLVLNPTSSGFPDNYLLKHILSPDSHSLADVSL